MWGHTGVLYYVLLGLGYCPGSQLGHGGLKGLVRTQALHSHLFPCYLLCCRYLCKLPPLFLRGGDRDGRGLIEKYSLFGFSFLSHLSAFNFYTFSLSSSIFPFNINTFCLVLPHTPHLKQVCRVLFMYDSQLERSKG